MFGHLYHEKISEGHVSFNQDQYFIDYTSFACHTPN